MLGGGVDDRHENLVCACHGVYQHWLGIGAAVGGVRDVLEPGVERGQGDGVVDEADRFDRFWRFVGGWEKAEEADGFFEFGDFGGERL